MMNNYTQHIKDIIGVLENLMSRDVLRENNEALKKIGLFVLLIGKLEDRIKAILSPDMGLLQNTPNWRNRVLALIERIFQVFQKRPFRNSPDIGSMTLGVAIKELKKRLPKIRDAYIRNPRDYRHNNFLRESNIQLFISQCSKLNKLRNDLIHNFVCPQRSGLENIQQILDQVEKMLVGADNWDAHSRERQHQEILASKKPLDDPDQLHIMTPEGGIRDDLPLDGLIEICGIFYQILKQLRTGKRS